MKKRICIDANIFENLLKLSLKNCVEENKEKFRIIQENFELDFPKYEPGIVNKNIENILKNSPIQIKKKLSYLVEIVNDLKNYETIMIDWIYPAEGIFYYKNIERDQYHSVDKLKKIVLYPNDKLFIFDDSQSNNCVEDKPLYKFIVTDNFGNSEEIIGTCSKKYTCIKK